MIPKQHKGVSAEAETPSFFKRNRRYLSVFFVPTGATVFFLHFAEKMLDFFAFFRYHILRSGKKTGETEHRQSGNGDC